ncbi:hypothetical protein BsWGS_14420 [Bradybaena similaris]
MAIKTSTFIILSFVFASVGLVALIIAFVSDRWVVSTEKEVSGFKNIGLWAACFSKYRAPAYALVDKYYDGCWWVYNREIDELRSFLFPPWFVATQVLVTTGLCFQLLAMILMIVNSINCFPYTKHRDTISLVLTIIVGVLHGLTAIFLTVAVIMFGARADNERTWLERPDQNYLSWSYGMCVLAAFLAILSFMTVSVELHRQRLKRREAKMFLTAAPPPPSPYSVKMFSPGSVNRPPTAYPNRYSNQTSARPPPAYINRYSNQTSGRPPHNTFGGGGAGESYVNHAYVNDENRQRGRVNGYDPPYGSRQQARRFDDVGKVDGMGKVDGVDAQSSQYVGKQLTAAETEDAASKETLYKSDDYEQSKKTVQPVLTEYVPQLKSKNAPKINIDNTLDESCDSETRAKNKDMNSTNQQSREQKESRSDSRRRKSTRNTSESEKRKKTQKSDEDIDKKTDNGRSRHRSKQRENDSFDSDKENTRSRQSKRRDSKRRKQSHSRERSSSRHRSRSRDAHSSESCDGSDSASVASRSRKKNRNGRDSIRKEKRHHSASKNTSKQENHKHSSQDKSKTKKKHNDSDELSGSEYSSVQKSKNKHGKAESEGKMRSKSRDYSDTESIRSRQRSKKHDLAKSDGNKRGKSLEYSDTESVRSRQRSRRRTGQVESDGNKRAKSRDFSDTESIRSKQSRRSDFKPKGTYSSYYE